MTRDGARNVPCHAPRDSRMVHLTPSPSSSHCWPSLLHRSKASPHRHGALPGQVQVAGPHPSISTTTSNSSGTWRRRRQDGSDDDGGSQLGGGRPRRAGARAGRVEGELDAGIAQVEEVVSSAGGRQLGRGSSRRFPPVATDNRAPTRRSPYRARRRSARPCGCAPRGSPSTPRSSPGPR